MNIYLEMKIYFTELFAEGSLVCSGDGCLFSLVIPDDSGDLIELATGEPFAVDIGACRVKKCIRFCVR